MKKTFPFKRLTQGVSILILTILLSRCDDGFKKAESQKQPDLTQEEISRLVLLEADFNYSKELAIQEALKIASELDAEDAKNGLKVSRTISKTLTASIPDTIQFPHTDRSGKNDPGMHIFNFADNKGYAIISGDKRAFGRLGWSDQGAIDNSETGKKAQMIIYRLATYIQRERAKVEQMRGDKDFISLLLKLSKFKGGAPVKDSKATINGRTTLIALPCQLARTAKSKDKSGNVTSTLCEGGGCSLYQSSSLISTASFTSVTVPQLMQTTWNQNTPYNNYYGSSACGTRWNDCGTSANNNYYAGCVEVAEAQVIAYFYGKNPAKWGAAWSTIANTPQACSLISAQTDMVSNLVRRVYSNYNFTMHICVGDGGTFTFPYPDNGISSSFGLQNGSWGGYDVNNLTTSLQMGSPVPVLGTEHLLCWCMIWDPIFGCLWEPCTGDPTTYHEWVMDGLETIGVKQTYVINPVDYDACEPLPSYYATYVSSSTKYVHNNWGWGGYHNGWYVEGAFGGWNSSHTDNVYSFNHDDKIISFIKPL